MPADKNDEGKQPGFTVSDRRIFSDSGAPKAAEDEKPAPNDTTAATASPSADPAAAAVPNPTGAAVAGSPTAARDLPTVDFHTFILSLGSSALLHLGELDHPDGTESTPDLALAKHTIDIIAMLQDKTKGNLSSPEDRLIESLLYDLRLRYVERRKDTAKG